jgi:glutathione S-transferase
MSSPIVYGPTYSTYVRTVRLALEEKPSAYELVDVAMLQGAHQEPAFLHRNPFGKVPAFSHDGLDLYETNVITRYIDRAIPGAALQPTDARGLARMDQVISIADSFAYGCVIGKLVWQRIVAPMLGGTPDDAAIAASMPQIELTLKEFERLLGEGPWFAGASISLADLHLAPIFAYLTMTPESAGLLASHAALTTWWSHMSVRESMAKTQPKFD